MPKMSEQTDLCPDGPEVVKAWLDRMAAGDHTAIMDLYDHDAVVDALWETLQGRDQIMERLDGVRHHLHKLRLQSSTGPRIDADGLCFETILAGILGRIELTHRVHVRDGRILDHRVRLVQWDRVRTAAS